MQFEALFQNLAHGALEIFLPFYWVSRRQSHASDRNRNRG